ncbi:ATP-binding protein [Paenibacillus sp. FSL L8-0696]|uniref:ATP-binding protein n=1 Tax=Paenibacillus sp. FSL L8-0696 TaxID=2954524 RepID=UPI003119DCF6
MLGENEMVVLPNGNVALKAHYHPSEIKLYEDNPLIEALPPILSVEDAFEQLTHSVEYNESERELSSHYRYHALMGIARFFQPVRDHLDLQDRFSRLLRQGYVGRNPRSKSHIEVLNAFHKAIREDEKVKIPPDIRSTASSITLVGFSGIGKTTAIERVLSLYPQLIVHTDPNVIQVVYLKLNCSYDGTLKSLCMDFFVKIDNLIGTTYYEKYGNRNNSIASMVTRIGQIARLHCIGALIIDEIQHMQTSKDNGSEKMMNFFVSLVNEIGISVMMIGTMKARAILQKDFRQARRGSGHGDMVWEQMKRGEDWDILIESIWEYQWTKNYTELTEEIKDTIYEESQGITDIAVKLFALAQGRAIRTELERLTPKLISTVAKEELRLVQPMINALRSGMISNIEKYEDIIPMDIESYLNNKMPELDMRAKIQAKKEELAQKRNALTPSLLQSAVVSLGSLNYDLKKAEKVVITLLKELTDPSPKELLMQAIEVLDHKESMNSNRYSVMKASKENINELQKVIEEGKNLKISAYEILKQKGFIPSPLVEFSLQEVRS